MGNLAVKDDGRIPLSWAPKLILFRSGKISLSVGEYKKILIDKIMYNLFFQVRCEFDPKKNVSCE